MKTTLLLFLLFLFSTTMRAQTPPAGFVSTTVSAGWDEAVGLTFNSTGSRMFVWERPGRVWTVANGQRQLMLDISPEVGAWEDHGLLGFALDPNFDTNGYFYLLYVVDRHYLLNFGTASYSATANDYYSATIGRLTRYTAVPSGTGYTVNPASRLVLLGATKTTGIPSTFDGHVTAALAFGTDGTLLIATGDGAHPFQDMGNYNLSYAAQALADGIITAKENVGSLRAQLVDCLNGKILRINPATGAGVPSNPFYDAANPSAARSRVWALGFRNPFRMTLKPGTGSTDPAAGNPGTIYLGDVGAATWEEVDVIDRPRVNCGWPLFEGLTPFTVFQNASVANLDAPNPLFGTGGCTQQYFTFQNLITQATPTGTATFPNPCNAAQTVPASVPTFVHTRPLIDWNHNTSGPARAGIFSGGTAATVNIGAAGSPVSGAQFGGSAATGGVFYPYADWPAQYRNTYFFGDYVGGWVRSLTVSGTNQPSAVNDFVGSGAVPVAFATSPGETGLFYVNFYPSEIRKISYGTTGTPPVAVASVNKTFGPSPLAVQFTGSNSTDPAGSSLTYLWNFGDGTTSSAANPAHTFTTPNSAPEAYTVTLTVTNGQGLSNQATVLVSANNTPPQVTITSPAAGTLYPLTANTVYQLRATVTDAEQSGHLLSYQWQTILHHQTHEHPDPIDTTRQTSTTIVPYGCGTETYYYRILLTVTDAAGLATTQEVRLNPDCNATSFTLINADTDTDIQSLVNGAVLDLATLPTRNLNIRANANPATTASVVFSLSGAATQAATENVVPYALFSDDGGNYFPWTPPVGSYVLTAMPYSASGGTGTPGQALTISFSVTDGGATGPFTLSTSTVGNGSVAVSPSQATYPNGTSVTLTATPAAGYTFSGWSGAATGSTNPLTLTMNANKAVTATFTAISTAQSVVSYTLVNASTGADIQTLAAGAVLNLATLPSRNLNIRANTNPATVGSVVFALSGAASRSQTESVVPYALFSDDAAGTYYAWTPALGSYTLLATPYTAGGGTGTAGPPLSVGFSVIDQAAGPFTLTTSIVGNGSISKNPNQTSYASGTSVTLTATPAAGYTFSGWSGDATGTTNPLTISMTANKAITATFTAAPTLYTLSVSTVGSGSVTKNPNQTSYASGTTVTLTATPASGYAFSGWSGGATGSTNPLTVTMTANKTITATFTALPAQYTLTTTVAGSGTVTKNPNQTSYASGTTVTLTATPASGYAFSGWSGGATGSTNPLTVTMTANKAITATFTATTVRYTLTTSVVGSGTVTKNPNATNYLSGSSVTLTATPAAGFQFGGWSGAATGTTNPLTVLMTANKTITATFTAQQVTGFVLVNADTDLDLQPLASGATLNLATLPTRNLGIRATTNPATVGSVTFSLTGAQAMTHTENLVPYSLLADSGGDYPAWTPPVGSYTLKATPYSGADASGTVGTALSISFSVTSAAARPAAGAALATGSTPVPAAALALQTLIYPNPSPDGHFWLVLPAHWQGPVRYRVLSALGATVASGELAANGGSGPLLLAPQGITTGFYMLWLDYQTPDHRPATAQLRLLRE
ncbi:InlB B-repeat-containing protein [Hymenobacter convexus]|uniref:InlB B-repeat-containing protein n=1 Tax=Hymenobacter sp. CA1UV-4 TaxID=3063782 RepID=UPI002713BB5B|nr:PQQ-dependent sugar dehydrogenase [Hymenobacter sp. CA1UV-4]MDO7852484.1 PQQ-dependent sugar dehydrogenase [Hymenobacter sp. CA1UV-4]